MAAVGGDSFESASSVAVGSTNFYFAGTYGNTTRIGTTSLTNNSGYTNVFLSHHDFYCTPLWARSPVTDGPIVDVKVASIVNDAWLAGGFLGTNISFEGAALTNYAVEAGRADIFLANYNRSGGLNGLKHFGGSLDDRVKDVMGSSINTYLTGWFNSPVFHAGGVNLNFQGTNQADGFIIKCDLSGNVVWARQATNGGGNSIVVDSAGNVYVSGTVLGEVSINSLTLSNQTGGTFLVKLDSAGAPLWIRGDMNIGTGITVDRAQNIVTVGAFTNLMQFGATTLSNGAPSTVYVAKFDSSGAVLWARQLEGLGNDRGTGITVDNKTNYWISGSFRNPDFSDEHFFLACIDRDGQLLGVSQAGGAAGTLVTELDNAFNGGSFNIALCGNFATNLTISGITVTNNGNPDAFVARLDMVPPAVATVVTNNDLVLSWPQFNDGYTNATLESSTDASLGSWAKATNATANSGGRTYTTNSVGTGNAFFRLKMLSR